MSMKNKAEKAGKVMDIALSALFLGVIAAAALTQSGAQDNKKPVASKTVTAANTYYPK